MRVEKLFEDDQIFAAGSEVQVLRGSVRHTAQIEFSREQHGRFVLKLRGIDSIDDAEGLVGAELEVPETALPLLDAGVFYTFHLKGCRVFESTGECLGVVTAILDNTGTNILKVDGESGEILIPFAESFVRNVDLEQRRIDVDLPEGLRDLNRS